LKVVRAAKSKIAGPGKTWGRHDVSKIWKRAAGNKKAIVKRGGGGVPKTVTWKAAS